jgi:hypothetical protein
MSPVISLIIGIGILYGALRFLGKRVDVAVAAVPAEGSVTAVTASAD